jgi:hypothetical protein
VKAVELWGGPFDGMIVRLPHTAEVFTRGSVVYKPIHPGDYADNRFRYQERSMV